ncbi:MAG TPA: 3-deoxy-D-manno-octulosonic acid transferase [Pyrinomonadaceae bacterium]|nr:3-deoxy-D-manno-octulosonic acid transferase [Pyrinomonadaceae bacterium]
MPVLLMYFIYSLLLAVGFLILLPRFLYDAFRHGKYVAGFRERLGTVSPVTGQPLIWIHCVSVGETQAARPLVLELKKQLPNFRIAISTTTLTGQNLAREIFKYDVEKIFYFPFDWRWTVRRTLKALRPEAVLIMETELWPGFLRECERQQIPVVVLNGRLSERSFRRYRLFRGFMSRVLRGVSLAIMQTEPDAARLRLLGIATEKVKVSGSLKFDAGTLPLNDELTAALGARFNFNSDAPLILAASTHAPEERIVIEAVKQLIAHEVPRARLLIAPRHPERFGEVAALIEALSISWARRSASPQATDGTAKVVLLDTIGELQSVYPLATIVLVGGSIAKTGGHNILEPAAVGACILTGAHTYNFREIVEAFVRAEAIVQLPAMPDSDTTLELGKLFAKFLTEPDKRRLIGERAKQLVNQNRGATERTMELLQDLLANRVAPVESATTLQRKHART